jgi:plasmid stabilization system protein ParE
MYAATFVRRIREVARSLDELYDRGRVVPEFEAPDIRELIVGNYRLVYQVTQSTVVILRVIHGARQIPGLERPHVE